MRLRKGLLNEVSIQLGREIWERCRWAEGEEEGIPGHRTADFAGSQSLHPCCLDGRLASQAHMWTQCRGMLAPTEREEMVCKSGVSFMDNFFP